MDLNVTPFTGPIGQLKDYLTSSEIPPEAPTLTSLKQTEKKIIIKQVTADESR